MKFYEFQFFTMMRELEDDSAMLSGNERTREDFAMAPPFSKPLEFDEVQFLCDVYVMCREGWFTNRIIFPSVYYTLLFVSLRSG